MVDERSRVRSLRVTLCAAIMDFFEAKMVTYKLQALEAHLHNLPSRLDISNEMLNRDSESIASAVP